MNELAKTESVLIDGVAYTLPIEVACELLRLEIELLTAQNSAWQPIETAPKDETVILISMPAVGAMRGNASRRVYEGRWHCEQDTWTGVNGFLLLTGATHWMPLPKPHNQDQTDLS